MPKVTLPNGSVLTGPKAEEYIKAQKKAEKEAKKELKAEVKEALRLGASAEAAKAELKAASAAAKMSSAEAFQEAVIKEIRSGKHSYRFVRVHPADSEVDADAISFYQRIELAYHDVKDAPGPKDIPMFVGKTYGKDSIYEVHPSLLKKSGKLAIEIPEGAMVAVRTEENKAQRLAPSFHLASVMALRDDISITHHYICAVLPADLIV